ncbi:MAG: hypothetical protein GQ574_09795 [Crocinitomix sp.]|nr:hypothetical protein [Crocinitomix sp.]
MKLLVITLLLCLQPTLYAQLEMRIIVTGKYSTFINKKGKNQVQLFENGEFFNPFNADNEQYGQYGPFSKKKGTVQFQTFENGEFLNQFNAGIEYHGQSSRRHPKKNFDFEIRDQAGEAIKTAIFGMKPGDDFVLNSMAFDGSYIRNALIFECWKKMGYWSPDYRYLNLYINDEFQGLYLICEKVKVAEDRVNIKQDSLVNSNYLFKMGRYWDSKKAFFLYQSTSHSYLSGTMISFKSIYPKLKKANKSDFSILSGKLTDLSQCLAKIHAQSNLIKSCQDCGIDLQSFIDYFLISELTKNPDAYIANLYLMIQSRKPTNETQLSIGPQWDYDLAFANTKKPFFQTDTGWSYIYQSQTPQHDVLYWWNSLSNSNAYKKACADRLQALGVLFYQPSKSIESIADSLTSIVRPYYKQDSVLWNNGTIELPSNLKTHETLDKEVSALLSFFNKRLKWVHSHINRLPKANEPIHALLRKSEGNIYPLQENNLNLHYPPNDPKNEFPGYYSYEIYDTEGKFDKEGILDYDPLSISFASYKKGIYFLHIYGNEGYYDDPDRYLNRPAVSAIDIYEDLYYRFTVE